MNSKKLFIASIIIFAIAMVVIMFPLKQKNLHEPFSKEEITNLIDPPLDKSKPLNEALFEKYYYPPKIQGTGIEPIEMQLFPKMLEVMRFEQYGSYNAFVFTQPADSMETKSERPVYMVEWENKKMFEDAVNNNNTLLFRQSGKQVWTFYESK